MTKHEYNLIAAEFQLVSQRVEAMRSAASYASEMEALNNIIGMLAGRLKVLEERIAKKNPFYMGDTWR